MTIKRNPVIDAHGMEYQVEERVLDFEIGVIKVHLKWHQHSTLMNGSIVKQAPPVIRADLRIDKERYTGHIYVGKDGGYGTGCWYKQNAERQRQFDETKIQKTLDQIWAFYTSPEGQKLMIEQSIAAVQAELKELHERTALLNGWFDSLIKELTSAPINEGSQD